MLFRYFITQAFSYNTRNKDVVITIITISSAIFSSLSSFPTRRGLFLRFYLRSSAFISSTRFVTEITVWVSIVQHSPHFRFCIIVLLYIAALGKSYLLRFWRSLSPLHDFTLWVVVSPSYRVYLQRRIFVLLIIFRLFLYALRSYTKVSTEKLAKNNQERSVVANSIIGHDSSILRYPF